MTTHELKYVDPSLSYSSFDIGLVAALISRGYVLIAVDKTDRRKARFLVQRASGIDAHINNYWDGKLTVDARSYFDNLKMLKNRLYSD